MSHENKQVELRRRARSVVAEIHCAYDRDTKKFSSMVGTILVANKHFCYLMAKRSLLSDEGSYTIYLPDGSSKEIGASEFFDPPPPRGMFAGCYIYHDELQYDIKQIAAIQFGEDVGDFDEVHLSDFSAESIGCLYVTGGRVL